MNDKNNDTPFSAQHGNALPELYGTSSLDDFVVTAMRTLPKLVHSDITSYNEVNIGANRVKSIMDSPRAMSLVAEDSSTFNRLLVEENPLVTRLMADRSTPLKISDFLSHSDWHKTTIFRRLYGRLGLHYQMAFVLNVEPPTIVAFALNRSDRDFDEEDRARLSALQPHMEKAYENAMRLEAMTAQLANRGRMIDALDAGWIEVSQSMHISEISPLIRDTFAEMFPEQQPDALPGPLRDWLVAALSVGPGQPALPFEASLDRAVLTFTLMGATDEGPISIMVERSSTGLNAEDLAPLGLTARQAEVLFWISQGKSNADVSVILRISVRTVENHVMQILETLNVKNRTQAAAIALEIEKTRGSRGNSGHF